MKLFQSRRQPAEAKDDALTRQDVIDGFRWILGREPESEETINAHLGLGTRRALRDGLMSSEEYLISVGERLQPTARSLEAADLDLFRRYHRPSAGEEGYLIDFLGGRTDINFNHATMERGGEVESPPLSGNFHSGPIEWIGLLRSVDQATDSFTMAELGAGWGPWLVAGAIAAHHRGLRNVALVGVEADNGHFDFLRKHLSDNGISDDIVTLFHGAVAPEDGTMLFPEIDPMEDWGAAAIQTSAGGTRDYRGKDVNFKEVSGFSLETILKGIGYLDLCHIDIQGAEREIIRENLDLLSRKVRRIVVGTHSRSIEGELFDRLSLSGWQLELEEPCEFRIGKAISQIDEGLTVKDGTQVWLNPRLERR